MADQSRARYTVRAVVDAFGVLEALRNITGSEGESAGSGVTEISRTTGLQKNKVFRLLATLESLGYVEQQGADGNYRLAPGCLSIARAYLAGERLLDAATATASSLSSSVRETVFVALASGDFAVPITVSHPDRRVSYRLVIGALLPMKESAAGIVLLSNERPAPNDAPPAGRETNHGAGNKGFDDTSLAGLVAGVHRNGYFVDVGIYDPECTCLAAPVVDGRRTVRAALCVAGPRERMTPSSLEDTFVPTLLAAAASLGASIV